MSPAEPSTHEHKVYESAVDRWLVVVLLTAPALTVVLGLKLWIDGRPGDAATLFASGAVVLAITAALTLPCRYTLLSDALSVRCGVVFYQIPLRDIQRVERSASWRSGPALSLRRVLVATGRRAVLVSPKDRDQFITDLEAAVDRVKTI